MDESGTGIPAGCVGVLVESAPGEQRVALVPETARRLVRDGRRVVVESGAGRRAWYTDGAYRDAGVEVATRREVFERASIILAVSRPPADDLRLLSEGQIIVGLLDPASDPEVFSQLASRGVTAASLERLPRTLSRAQAMDVLTSQASVAGYKAVLVAATEFGRYFPLLITAAGTSRPARVLVLGAGVAGLSAIGTARRLGAVVTGYDVRPETRAEIESLGAKFLDLAAVGPAGGSGGYARALTADEQRAQQQELESRLPSFDVVITTAAVPGRRPPVLVSAAALTGLRAGTVVVDMASGPLGGNVEGSVPGTTVVTDGGVTVIGAADLASSVPTAASDAFSQNMAALLGLLFRDGRPSIDLDDEVTAAVVVTHGRRLVQPTAPAGAPPAAGTPPATGQPPGGARSAILASPAAAAGSESPRGPR